MENKNKIDSTIIMFHSLPGHYSVEICDFNSTVEEYQSVSKAYFHNFFTKQDNHYGLLYTYNGKKNSNAEFKLKMYQIS